MQQRLPSLLEEPIAFAHRGARAHAPENTIEAFELALRLGASGLETDAWLTADREVVLVHDGMIGSRFRRRTIDATPRAALPEHVPTIGELLDACGSTYHLSIDLKDAATGPLLIEQVRERAPELLPRLWLCHFDPEVLVGLRSLDDGVKLVLSTKSSRFDGGPERRAASLAAAGIDAINLHHTEWHGGLVALFHRFDVVTFGWDLQFEHHLRPALRMGLDGVYSDHVDLMVEVYRDELGALRPPT